MNNSDMPAMAQDGCWKTDMEQHLCSDKYGAPSFDGIGLTKREHFAAMAMQGLLSSEIYVKLLGVTKAEDALLNISVMAAEHADALLAALEANNES